MDKGPVLMGGFRFQDATDHLQPFIAEALQATAGDARVRIAERDHHPFDPSREDRLGAGWSAALMATGLKGDNQRSTLSCGAGLGQGGEKCKLNLR